MFRSRSLPPIRLLSTFESAARLGSFSEAAEELLTTQSAVSRSVAELERHLGHRLFDRVHRGVRLTAAGEMYREAVVSGLNRISAMGAALDGLTREHIVIACGHATAAMFLMPLREALYEAVGGGDTHVRILTCDYDLLDRVGADEVDVKMVYDPGGAAPEDRALAFCEAIAPVCSPAFAAEHADTLRRPVAEWGCLTFLVLARPQRGWSTWEDWFGIAGRPASEPRYRNYSDYVFLIEDAVAGKGLALGWRRFVDRHLDSGALVHVTQGFAAFDRAHWAVLTERGRARPRARQCLGFFDGLSRRVEAGA